jgi:zinc protease
MAYYGPFPQWNPMKKRFINNKPSEEPLNPKTLILGGLLAATPLAAKDPLPLLASVADGVSKKVLPNGMTILVKEVHSAPVVAVNAWVKVGSVDELDKERGITHFIEHMLFKGTEKLKVGELDKRIKAAGGYNNAHTRYESTDFIDVLPADKFDEALETMADALQHSTFNAEELDRERKVVLEELHRSQDNPGFEAWNRLTHLVFERHPYKYPVIGYKDLLLTMNRDDLSGYWKKWYRPQNIVFVVVGDVDAKQVQDKVAAALGSWTASVAKAQPFPSEKAPTQLKLEEFTGDMETTVAVLGVPGPAELDADAPAVDMALAILGQGLSSRLNQVVREQKQLVQDVSAGMFNGQSPGLIYLWADLEAPQVKGAMQAMWAEVERMKAEPVSTEELARQMVKIESDEAGDRMSMEGMAGKLGYYECLGDYKLSDSITQKMRAVTAEDIRRVMNKYFQVQKAALVIYRPAKSKAVGLSAKDWDKALSAVKAPQAEKPVEARVEGAISRYEFANGLTLLVKPIRHTPLVAMQALFPGGAKVDPPGKAGAFNLLARLLTKGGPGLDASQIADSLDDLGASLAPYADADRFAVSGLMLSSKFEDTLELAGKLLRHATLPADEMEKERDRVLKSIKDKSDQADDYIGDVFNTLYFKGTPFEFPVDGTTKSVKAIRRDDLAALQQRYIAPDRMLLVLVGDVDPDAARSVVDRVFGPSRWPAHGGSLRVAPIAAIKAQARSAKEKLNKKQAHVMLGWPAPKPGDADYYAARILNSVFGEGMDSRLFVEVRDKRALCYTVSSSMDRREDPGAWRVYVGTQPENEKKAIAIVLGVAKDLADNGISPSELEAAKAYSKGIFKVARQDFSTEARLLGNYEFWGLGASEIDRMAAKVDAVSLADVQKAAKKYLLTEKTTIAVIRP